MAATSGNVGIGTSSPRYALDVVGQVWADNVEVTSNIRLKTDIAPLTNALEGVQCLQAVTYRWRDPSKSQDVQLGLIAQEVETCFPEVVSTDESGYKSVAYGRLVAPLAQAIQEQQQTITGQEAVIETLKRRDEVRQRELTQMNARLAGLEALLDPARQ